MIEIKGTVSRSQAWEMTNKFNKIHKNNRLKQWRNISIAQQIQKKVRMAKVKKIETDCDMGFWNTVELNSFQS